MNGAARGRPVAFTVLMVAGGLLLLVVLAGGRNLLTEGLVALYLGLVAGAVLRQALYRRI